MWEKCVTSFQKQVALSVCNSCFETTMANFVIDNFVFLRVMLNFVVKGIVISKSLSKSLWAPIYYQDHIFLHRVNAEINKQQMKCFA